LAGLNREMEIQTEYRKNLKFSNSSPNQETINSRVALNSTRKEPDFTRNESQKSVLEHNLAKAEVETKEKEIGKGGTEKQEGANGATYKRLTHVNSLESRFTWITTTSMATTNRSGQAGLINKNSENLSQPSRAITKSFSSPSKVSQESEKSDYYWPGG
jgi:hypothetical protein